MVLSSDETRVAANCGVTYTPETDMNFPPRERNRLPGERLARRVRSPGKKAPRRSSHLTPILSSYRKVALGLALVLTALAVAFVMALHHPAYAMAPNPMLLVIAAAALVAGAALLIAGHRSIRLQLAKAAQDTEEIVASVHRDALTGVFTRSYLLQALRAEIFHGSSRSLGYLQLDMDNLKVLNDGAGHGAGDAALVHLAKAIAEVMPGAVIGRLGGDEFGIAVLDCDNRGALKRLGEELLRRLDQPIPIAGRPTRLSATIGFSLAPSDASDVDDLIAKADLALYKGKRAGRRQVIAFDPDMLGDERHRRFIERELRAALLMDELELHYQPVVGADMKVRSHEALLRWRHKVRGMIPPSNFITIAEESDLIDKVGEWVLRRALADISVLGTPVAINVSPAQLRRGDFAAKFATMVMDSGVEPSRIIIEITETVPLAAGLVEQGNLETLRSLGFRVAIDDFGAGHASLQYLRGFAFDVIKIDRTYVANIGESRIDAMIVEAICDIARSLEVDVVAEGVETEVQLELLRGAGCTAFQGYLIGRPGPLKPVKLADAA